MLAKVAKLGTLLALVASCDRTAADGPGSARASSESAPAAAPSPLGARPSAAALDPPAASPPPAALPSPSAPVTAPPIARPPRLRVAPPCVAERGFARWSWDRLYQIDGLPKKTALLTFDVGLDLDVLDKVLDLLAERKVRGTIFLMTQELEKQEERGVALVKRMLADGHELANHTVHHPHLTKLDDEAVKREVSGVEEWVKKGTGGSTQPFFREPFLDTDDRVDKLIQKLCYRSIWFTVYSKDDTKGVKAQDIEDAVFIGPGGKERKLPSGTVLLFHGSQKENLVALPRIIKRLEAQGFAFSTLGDALKTL